MDKATKLIFKYDTKATLKRKRFDQPQFHVEYSEVAEVIKILLKARQKMKKTESNKGRILLLLLEDCLGNLMKKNVTLKMKMRTTWEKKYCINYRVTQGALKQLLQLYQELKTYVC